MKSKPEAPWSRRSFLKACSTAATASVLPGVSVLPWLEPLNADSQSSSANLFRNANPLVGTGWRGHMFPGAVVPFGFVQLSPDTSGAPDVDWNI